MSISICATASSVSEKTANEPIVGRGALLVDVENAETLPGITFRVEELPVSSVPNFEVASLTAGTEFLSLNTRVILVTTEPFLKVLTKDRL